jgi:protein PhnA
LLFVCPEYAHEWTFEGQSAQQQHEISSVIKDAIGTVLQDGDTVAVNKDLKVKSSSTVVKVGTKVRNFRLVVGDHDIDFTLDGSGAMKLKSKFVRRI